PVVLRPVADGMKRFAHDGYLKRDDSDQITGSSISSMHVASIWETTPSSHTKPPLAMARGGFLVARFLRGALANGRSG
ncbi:MAG: hypothetical protein ACRC5V_05225, partial [Aeromonas sp.]